MSQTYAPQPTQEIRPKLIWVWISIGLMILAAIAFFAFVLTGASKAISSIDSLTLIEPNTSVTADLTSGTYTVYADQVSVGSNLTVTDSSGDEITVYTPSFDEEYDINGVNLTSFAEFDVDSEGRYDISNTGTSDLYLGPSIAKSALKSFVLGFVVGAILGIGGLVMLIVTLVRRRSAKNRLAMSNAGAQAGYPVQPGPGMYTPQPMPGAYNPQPGAYNPQTQPGTYNPQPGAYDPQTQQYNPQADANTAQSHQVESDSHTPVGGYNLNLQSDGYVAAAEAGATPAQHSPAEPTENAQQSPDSSDQQQ